MFGIFNIKKVVFGKQIGSLAKKIYHKDDKILFDEAVKSFLKEAYRSSYIMIWICVAESLRNKIFELSQKDTEAGKIWGEIQKCEQKNLSSDKLIVEKSEELGLLTKDEFKKINHLRDMRNSYAHPTGVAPLVEEIVSAFNVSVECVLSRPAQLKHGYVTSLLRSIFENRHYLDDDEQKIREYARIIAHRLHPEVLNFLLKKTCEYLDNCTEAVIKRRGVFFTNTLLEELKPDFKMNYWNIIHLMDQHQRSASLCLSSPILWNNLPIQAQDMCFGFLVEPTSLLDGSILNPSSMRLKMVNELKKAELLNSKQTKKYQEILKKVPYSDLIQAKISISEIVPNIIDDLKTHNWYKQNPAADALFNFGMEDVGTLSEYIQVELGRNILQSTEGSSASAISFINNIKDMTIPEKFAQGLLMECFTNERKEFRLKTKFLKEVLDIVINQKYSEKIIKIVALDITVSDPSIFVSKKDCAKVSSLIQEIIDTKVDKPKGLYNLKESINLQKNKA